MLIQEVLVENVCSSTVLSVRNTRSTGYKELRAVKTRIEVRGTIIIARTVYGEYGVRRVPCWWGTNSTMQWSMLSEYEFKHGVRIFISLTKCKE